MPIFPCRSIGGIGGTSPSPLPWRALPLAAPLALPLNAHTALATLPGQSSHLIQHAARLGKLGRQKAGRKGCARSAIDRSVHPNLTAGLAGRTAARPNVCRGQVCGAARQGPSALATHQVRGRCPRAAWQREGDPIRRNAEWRAPLGAAAAAAAAQHLHPLLPGACRDAARRALLDLLDSIRGRKALVLEAAFASPLGLVADALTLKEHGVEVCVCGSGVQRSRGRGAGACTAANALRGCSCGSTAPWVGQGCSTAADGRACLTAPLPRSAPAASACWSRSRQWWMLCWKRA